MLTGFYNKDVRIPLSFVKRVQTGIVEASYSQYTWPWHYLDISVGSVVISKTLIIHDIYCSNVGDIRKWHYGYDPDNNVTDGVEVTRTEVEFRNSSTLRVRGVNDYFSGNWQLIEFF